MSYIGEKIDYWLEKINDIPSLNRYRLIWVDFGDLFNTLNDEVNKILETNVQEIASQIYTLDQKSIHLNSCDLNKGKFYIFT